MNVLFAYEIPERVVMLLRVRVLEFDLYASLVFRRSPKQVRQRRLIGPSRSHHIYATYS